MSLILEALKKSEQQRRLGETPSLTSEHYALGPSSGGGGRKKWIALAVVLPLCTAVAAGWWYWRKPSLPSASPPIAVARENPANAKPLPGTGVARPDETSKSPLPSAALPPPVPQQVATVDLATQHPAQVVAAPPVPATQPATPNSDPAPAPVGSSAAAIEAGVATGSQAPASAGAPPAPLPIGQNPAPPGYEPALPSVDELPYSVRRALPKIKLTMHVYAEDASKRFALFGEERVTEGGSLTDGAKLVEIRKSGVVLEYQGQRFLLPSGGR